MDPDGTSSAGGAFIPLFFPSLYGSEPAVLFLFRFYFLCCFIIARVMVATNQIVFAQI
jgi:hypothetical protein